MKKRAVSILSGGMDSTLSTTIAIQNGYEIIAVHFSYGQRTQNREAMAFRDICDSLEIDKRHEIDLPFFTQIGSSALTDKNIEIPSHGIKPGVPVTYVPFRNGIFLSIATAIAHKYTAETLYIGVVEEDSSGYPDCRGSYIKSMQQAINLGLTDKMSLKIKTPLITLSKQEIVQRSIDEGAPIEKTWSCYRYEDLACGVCDSCRLRLKGFELAGLNDPLPYHSMR